MKKLFLMILSIILISGLLFGCSSPSTTTPSQSSPTMPAAATTPAPSSSIPTASKTSAPSHTSQISPSFKPIIIRLAPTTVPPPPSKSLTLTALEMKSMIETKTNGRVILEIYFSETLAKGTDLVNAVQTNTANMAWLRPYAEPGKIPLSTISEMPGVSNDMWALLYAFTDLMKQEPLVSELTQYNMRPLSTVMTNETQLISRIPIRTVADIKGKKIAASGIGGQIVKALGGVPLAMSPVEQYEGLSRGTVDGLAAPPDAVQSFKFYEAGKYYTKINLGPRVYPVVMNKDFWNALPQDIQKILSDLVPDMLNSAYDTLVNQTASVAFQIMAENKVEIIEISAEDIAQVNKVRNDIAASWAAEQEKAGRAGNKILEDYRSLAAKYEKISPYKK